MGKLLKTVFGKSGVVSNVVDLVTVPQHIDHKKSEISALKAQLQKVEKELAEVSEENVSATQITLHTNYIQHEQELTQLQERLAKMLKAQSEYADVFGDCLNNSMNIQIMTYQNQIMEFEDKLHNTKLKYDMHMNEIEAKRQTLQYEKKKIEDKLLLMEAKLVELQQKKDRKQGQLNNNLGKMF
jgi:flagellar biosynthesis chaperone FliJ